VSKEGAPMKTKRRNKWREACLSLANVASELVTVAKGLAEDHRDPWAKGLLQNHAQGVADEIVKVVKLKQQEVAR